MKQNQLNDLRVYCQHVTNSGIQAHDLGSLKEYRALLGVATALLCGVILSLQQLQSPEPATWTVRPESGEVVPPELAGLGAEGFIRLAAREDAAPALELLSQLSAQGGPWPPYGFTTPFVRDVLPVMTLLGDLWRDPLQHSRLDVGTPIFRKLRARVEDGLDRLPDRNSAMIEDTARQLCKLLDACVHGTMLYLAPAPLPATV